jgi:hypothetical protein
MEWNDEQKRRLEVEFIFVIMPRTETLEVLRKNDETATHDFVFALLGGFSLRGLRKKRSNFPRKSGLSLLRKRVG